MVFVRSKLRNRGKICLEYMHIKPKTGFAMHLVEFPSIKNTYQERQRHVFISNDALVISVKSIIHTIVKLHVCSNNTTYKLVLTEPKESKINARLFWCLL